MSKVTVNFARESADKVKNHFSGSKRIQKTDEVREAVQAATLLMCAELSSARKGLSLDAKGRAIGPLNITFSQAIEAHFGFKNEFDSTGQLVLSSYDKFLKALGIYSESMSIHDMAEHLGARNIDSVSSLERVLLAHGNNEFGNDGYSFDGARGTDSVPTDYRFLISEIILEPVRLNYLHQAMHSNWIAGTRTVDRITGITMPQIKKSAAFARRIGEGSAVPIGTTQYGQKQVGIFKLGTGLELTEELILQSSLSDMTIFMQDYSSQFAIGSDQEALDVLLNGEQDDLSESAPEVGVSNTSNGLDRPDMIRIPTRMRRLGLQPDRFITSEAISTKNVQESGTNGEYTTPIRFMSQQAEVGVRNQDVFNTPANKSVFLNSSRAMVKLQYGGMRVERDRDVETQKERVIITDRLGFAIVKRDARVIVNGGVTYDPVAGETGGFPTYMDIDSEIAETFN